MNNLKRGNDFTIRSSKSSVETRASNHAPHRYVVAGTVGDASNTTVAEQLLAVRDDFMLKKDQKRF